MSNFKKNWFKNKKILEDNHVYNELDEHSSCGVGLIASLDGSPKRKFVYYFSFRSSYMRNNYDFCILRN